MRTRRLLAPALLGLGAALLPAPAADAGEGFVGRCPLFPVAGAGADAATGGVTAWQRRRNDNSFVQGLRLWVRGLDDAEGATLWVTPPGRLDAEEVGDLAWAENGSAYFEVLVDSRYDNGAEIPGGAESMYRLQGAVFEVRVPGASLEDLPALRGRLRDFRWRDFVLRPGSPGTRGRTAPMVRPPPPVVPPDDLARGKVRVWRRPRPGGARMGISVFARGLTGEETYEVWIEDPAGDLQEVGSLESTGDGLGFWSLDTDAGDTLPPEAGEDDVRGLARRRIELRRSGFTDPSLVALFPRVR